MPAQTRKGPRRRRLIVVGWTLSVLAFVANDAPGVAAAPEMAGHRWGRRGHEMATRAALGILPGTLPAFFRDAGDQLVYLSPEPDRWRITDLREMNRAGDYDHYVDLENLPDGAIDAPDRFVFLKMLHDSGLTAREGGFVLFRIVELQQRLVSLWERWHAEDDERQRRYIEARIIDDAGVLGHFVTDASQPHHTTIHFDGWDPDSPNPEGFSVERGFHSRFETRFVNAHISVLQIVERMPPSPPSLREDTRAAVLDFILRSHAQVPALYRLDRDIGFAVAGPPDPRTQAFAADRLAAGSEMLAALWWSAFRAGRDRR